MSRSVLLKSPTTHPLGKPRFNHVTIVVMENKGYQEVIGNPEAPYINNIADSSVLFTNSYAVAHPSEPNYLALYSGSTQGLTSDDCPLTFASPSLGGELERAHRSIKGYMEDLPGVGAPVCDDHEYARKHDPLLDFSDTQAGNVVPYSQIVTDIATDTYPSVAFVIPNLIHDMHDGTITMGDQWLAVNLPPILAFDAKHNGILILTWDEDDRSEGNHIPTIAAGPMLKPGADDQRIDHYAVLRTVTDLFELPPLGNAAPIQRLEASY